MQLLEDLVTALTEGERTTYSSIINDLAIPKSVFENYCSWSDGSYTRNCIVDNEKFELILLCWEEGQKTPIHNHGGEECWVRVIDGELKETIYTTDENGKPSLLKSAVSKTNDVSYMVDFMGCHSLENVAKSRSMTLHLYAKPIRSCDIFDEESKQFVTKELFYDNAEEMAAKKLEK